YKFRFGGQLIRESSKSDSKVVAREAEHARRRELQQSWNQIKPRRLPPSFSAASTDWLKSRTGIASSTEASYSLASDQLNKDFGKRLLCDISPEDIASFQNRRKREGVSNRTVNIELAVLQQIMRKHRAWEGISQDVRFLKEGPSPGIALSEEEE